MNKIPFNCGNDGCPSTHELWLEVDKEGITTIMVDDNEVLAVMVPGEFQALREAIVTNTIMKMFEPSKTMDEELKQRFILINEPKT